MTFDSARLKERFSKGGYKPLDIRRLDGTIRVKAVPADEFTNLVEAGVVEGVGTYRRLRYLRQVFSDETADAKIREKFRDKEFSDTLRNIDSMLKMMSARKTTYRERLDIPSPDGTKAVFIFQHKGMHLGYD